MDKISEFAPGTIIDNRYEIISRLGAGGFAVVYKARHIKMEREAAIKIMSTDLIREDDTYSERFIREAQIGASFSHPNAVTFYDYGVVEETGQPYIAMEYLQGHDLHRETLINGPMNKARAYKLFVPVLEALSCGHQKGIIHRDLKPENLFIVNPGTPNEVMKVMDFGISKVENDGRERLTDDGKILGTPSYFAPEYIESQLVIPAGDVYQMALIISEALNGKTANPYKSTPALYAHINGDIQLCEFLKKGRVGKIYKRAYCVDCKKRYQNCGEFLAALKSVEREFLNDETEDVHSVPAVQEPVDDGEAENLDNHGKKAEIIEQASAEELIFSTAPTRHRKKLSKKAAQQSMLKGMIIGLGICAVVVFAIVIAVQVFRSDAESSSAAAAFVETAATGESATTEVIAEATEVIAEATEKTAADSVAGPTNGLEQPGSEEPSAKSDELLTAEELQLVKTLNWLPAGEELDEIKELWKTAETGDVSASEQLARHYLQLPKSREHYLLAHKALSLSDKHSNPMSMYAHARLGIQIMNSEHRAFLNATLYDHYIEDILSAIEAGYKPAIFGFLGLSERESAETLNQIKEIQKGDIKIYLEQRSADLEKTRNSLFLNSAHMTRIINALQHLDATIRKAPMNEDEYIQWKMVSNRLQQLASVLSLTPGLKSKLNDVIHWIESRIKNDAKNGDVVARMIMGTNTLANNPGNKLKWISDAADKGVSRALCIMTDLYMQLAQPETISGELPNTESNKKAVEVLRSQIKLSKEALYGVIEGNLKRMNDGTCGVDIVRFYQNIEGFSNPDETFSNSVIDYLFKNAENSDAPRKACDKVMEQLKYEYRTGLPKDMFSALQTKIYTEAENCYKRVLLNGFDYPQSEWSLEADSSAQILLQLYRNHDRVLNRESMMALMVYGAAYGDGIMAGNLAMSYRDGDGVQKNDDRMRFWAARAVESSQCRRCQSDLYQMPMCDVCVEAASMAK